MTQYKFNPDEFQGAFCEDMISFEKSEIETLRQEIEERENEINSYLTCYNSTRYMIANYLMFLRNKQTLCKEKHPANWQRDAKKRKQTILLLELAERFLQKKPPHTKKKYDSRLDETALYVEQCNTLRSVSELWDKIVDDMYTYNQQLTLWQINTNCVTKFRDYLKVYCDAPGFEE